MGREKASRARRTHYPIRLQDGTALDRATSDALRAEMTAIAAAAATEAALAARRATALELRTATIDLPAGRRSGSVDVDGAFTSDQVGTRVIVTQGPPDRIEDAEAGIVLFVGQVVSRTVMRVTWFAVSPAPRRVRILYLV
jgi:hypothetical protein